MSGQTLNFVMAGARNIIESITPDFEPLTTFKAAPMTLPLELTPFGSPSQGTRAFHVISGVMAGLGGSTGGNWNGGELHHLQDHIMVRVRYHCPFTADGYGRLNDFVSTDIQRIYSALGYASESAWGGEVGCPSTINLVGSSQPIPINEGPENDVWVVNIPFSIQTFLQE